MKFILGRKIQPTQKQERRLNEVRVTALILKADQIFDQQRLLTNRYDPPRIHMKRSLSAFTKDVEEEYSFDEPNE